MATRSSYFLAVLLIANPFVLVLFQNCSTSPQERGLANYQDRQINHEFPAEPEASFKIDKNLIIK
ncbi:MAG: hypothetical protein AABY53_03915 [Bdellovibrionota bacterium]